MNSLTGDIYIEDAFYSERPVFRVTVTEKIEDIAVHLEVYRITSWSAEAENEQLDEELYLRAYMRRNNCNDFRFGEKDGSIKLDGGEAMANHLKLMAFLFNYSMWVLGLEQKDPLKLKALTPQLQFPKRLEFFW